MVVQLGFAIIPFGVTRASVAFASGTTRGTPSSIRNALELSIIIAPKRVISAAYSLETDAPAEVNTQSKSLNKSPCCKSCTVYSFPQNIYLVPALRSEPNNTSLEIDHFLFAKTLKNS